MHLWAENQIMVRVYLLLALAQDWLEQIIVLSFFWDFYDVLLKWRVTYADLVNECL